MFVFSPFLPCSPAEPILSDLLEVPGNRGVVHLAASRFSAVLGEFHGKTSAYARGNVTFVGAHAGRLLLF